jgi:predicted dehydrogenase
MVRVGVIGIGVMGSAHALLMAAGKIPGARLAAVCDIDPGRLTWAERALGNAVKRYSAEDELYASGEVDAVVIANYHYLHAASAIKAFARGLHVLVEKPAGVFTRQVREMNEAAAASKKIFGIMYNQRTDPIYRKARDLVASGELGAVKRTSWTATYWYRTQFYYDSCPWRATWHGEGGGVLINQCPHQLDLWQWICGMPLRVRAFCGYGRYHDIEVEDDVTAYVEYPNGATGVLITSTGEAPGTNRLEIAGDNGKIVVEDDKLTFYRLRVPERQFNRECGDTRSAPECWKCEVPAKGENAQHAGILTNWVDAIENGAPLIAPGEEGINGLMLSNAIHLSDWTGDWAELPVDEERYLALLRQRIAGSPQNRPNIFARLKA